MSYRTYRCPHCGREMQVPADAEKIVCMFCAQPIDLKAPADGQPQAEQSPAAEQPAAEQPPAGRAVPPMEAPGLLPEEAFTLRIGISQLNAKAYPEIFEHYQELVRPALRAYLRDAESDGTAAAEALADNVVARFAEERKKRVGPETFDCRFTITALLIPAVLELKSSPAERLAELILQKWNADYPKNPLGKATFEDIQKGFRKRLCFITTAVCRELGAGDSCRELEEFRAFRDGWLASSPRGEAKIAEYYLFAPLIVRAVQSSAGADAEFRRIWRAHLLPCLSLIRKGKPEACARRYEEMMRELEARWLS